MAWEISFTPQAAKTFRKLDKPIQRRVSRYLRELAVLDDPRSRGKALVGDRSGLWRWRVGDYRVIADIYDEKVTIIVLDMGHRRNIYE